MITTWGPTATCSSLNVLPPFSTGRTTLERALELRDAHAAQDGAPPPQPAPAMAISGPVLVKRMPRRLLRISRRDVVRVLLRYRGAGSNGQHRLSWPVPRRSVHETQQRAADQQHHGRGDVAPQEVNTVSRCALSSLATRRDRNVVPFGVTPRSNCDRGRLPEASAIVGAYGFWLGGHPYFDMPSRPRYASPTA